MWGKGRSILVGNVGIYEVGNWVKIDRIGTSRNDHIRGK